MKVRLKRFLLNGHTIGFHPQTQKLKLCTKQIAPCESTAEEVSFKWSHYRNRSLALRGHVTNASFKQWVGILLMPKIDGAHKNYLTPKIWEETHLRETFYETLNFQQSSIICIGRHVGGHTLALQHGDQNCFLRRSC